LTIIGSGPGGYVAAVLASKKGINVTVIEKGPIGGVCTNYGCIPSKALLSTAEKIETIKESKRNGIKAQFNGVNFDRIMSRKERAVNVSRKAIKNLFQKHGINVVEGEAQIISSDEIKVNGDVIKSDYMVIATGSEPISLPDVQIDENYILSSKGALELDQVPDSLLIIGGGYIGLEMAYIYSAMGSEVIIVELMEKLLPNMDKDLSAVAEQMMKRKRIKFFMGSKVTEVEENNTLEVQIEGKTEKSIEVEKVLCAVGRKPTPPKSEIDIVSEKGHIEVDGKLQTNFEGIYAIGDVNGKSMLAHSAFKQAEIALKDILDEETKSFSELIIPAGIYTHPEMATVGLTEEEAREKESEIEVGKFPMSATGRGSSTGERMGVAKVIADSKSKILGVHLACPGATDIIMEAATAIEKEMTAKELSELIHPHPTYSEAIKEAAENVSGESVHSG